MKKSFVILFSAALLSLSLTTIVATPVHAANDDAPVTDTTDSLAVTNKTGYIYFRHGEGTFNAYKDPALKIFGPEVTHFADRYMPHQAVAAYDQIATNTKTNQVMAYHIPDGWVGLDSWTANDPSTYTRGNDFGVVTLGNKTQQLYTDSKLLTPANRTLAAGTAWRYDVKEIITYKYISSVGIYAYQVGTNLWLPGTAVATEDSYPNGWGVSDQGIVKVTNRAEATMYGNLRWNNSQPYARKLAYGTQWRYPKAYISSKNKLLGFQVGNNQYVKASDVTIVPRRGVFTVTSKNGVPAVSHIGNYPVETRKLKVNTRWLTTGVQYYYGTVFYRVSTDSYVNGLNGTWTPLK
ncbi:hypothetical protein [Schleiferilactobacillus perolens]|nr:hypothetical protein [Schleiferilactobacillus perolens]